MPTLPRPRMKAVVKLLLKAGVTATLVGMLLMKADVSQVMSQIARIGTSTFLIATGLLAVLSLTVALRWQRIVETLGYRMSFGDSWRIVLISLFFNQFLPSGVGGDVVRVVSATRLGLPRGPAVVSVVVDRLCGLFAVGLCILAGLLYLPSGKVFYADLTLAGLLIVGFALLLGLDWLVMLLQRCPPIERSVLWQKLRRVIELVRMSSRTLLTVFCHGGTAWLALWTSLLNQLALGGIVFYIGFWLDPSLRLADALFLFPAAMLLSMLPISLGGWGIREGAMIFFWSAAGVSSAAALATSLTFGFAMTLSSTIGGLIWLAQPSYRQSQSELSAVSSEQ